jgi:Raf kinase inhibitor-like YbhB/YbcL family protein
MRRKTVKTVTVKSPAFEHQKTIPSKYTCDGDNINPPLTIEGIPEGTKSLVLIVDDPDAPMGTWDHWVVWNIPPTDKVGENSVPGTQGVNSARRNSYSGPCPPSGTHRYFFKVYALDMQLSLSSNSRKKDVENAMKNHILAQGEIIGLYRRT